MKTTINFTDFCDAFRNYDRNENFSYEGKQALFEYLEEFEDSTGEEIELDIIALCCDYNEDTFEDIANNYDIDLSGCENDKDKEETIKEYLEENTQLVGETSNSFIYAAF